MAQEGTLKVESNLFKDGETIPKSRGAHVRRR